MRKMTILKRLLPVLMLGVLSVMIGVTGATVLHTMQLENPIKTPPVEGKIEEDIKGNAKNAKFTNDGEADVFLRVAYTETWLASDGKTILPNRTKDESGNMISPAVPKWNTASPWDWSKESKEGWIYYKKVLPGTVAGPNANHSTGYIVTDVDFANVAKAADERYKTAKYRLHFTMEVVQASDDWDISRDAASELFHKTIALEGNSNWVTNKYNATIQWN